MGRAVLKTLKETTLNTLWWLLKEQEIRAEHHYRYFENKGLIKFTNGSEILMKDLQQYPSDPEFDELGSLEITGGFVDECNQTTKKAWSIAKSRIRYRLDEYGLVPKMLGTCNPDKGWTYTDFYAPSKNGMLPENKKFLQSLLNDNPNISKHYRDNLLSLDMVSKQRLLYGNWEYDGDPNALCEFDAIMDVFTNPAIRGEKAISADLAMQGRDRFVAGLWDGFVCDLTKGVDKVKSTGKEIEKDLKSIMEKNQVGHSRTIVDSDGLGAYLESYLEGIKQFHGGSKAFHDKEFANIKSECGYKLAELINDRKLKVICTDEQKQKIIEELGVLKSESVDADETRKRIIKKDKMKEFLQRSPDYLDMLLMGMWFHCRKKPTPIVEGGSRQGPNEWDEIRRMFVQ